MELPGGLRAALGNLPPAGGAAEVPAVVVVPYVVGQVGGGIPLELGDAVAHPGEPAPAVLVLEVLEPGLADGLEVVQRGAGPVDGRLAPVGPHVVVVAAGSGPDHAPGGPGDVGLKVVGGGGLEAHAAQRRLRLVLVDEGEDVVALGLDGDDDGPVGDGRPGPGQGEAVGALGDPDPQVARYRGRPVVLQVVALEEDGVSRHVGGVEARGADDHVGLVRLALLADAPVLGEGFDS